MRAARSKWVSMPGSASDLLELRDDFGDGRRRHDLAIRARSQQRLGRGQVAGDLHPVFRHGPERIGPAGDSIENDLDRRAQ